MAIEQYLESCSTVLTIQWTCPRCRFKTFVESVPVSELMTDEEMAELSSGSGGENEVCESEGRVCVCE